MLKDIKEQIEVADKIVKAFNSGIKNVLLIAPTGAGKSGIAYQVHKRSRSSVCILSHQKILQDQYDALFSSLNNAVTVKGQNNYECCRFQNITVDKAPCKFGQSCDVKSSCKYFVLREKLKKIDIGIINYQFLFSMLNLPVPFEYNKNIYIFDECHSIENVYTDFCSVSINRKEQEQFIKLQAKCDEWMVEGVSASLDILCKEIDNILARKYTSIKEFNTYYEEAFNLTGKISNFIEDNVKALEKKHDLYFFANSISKISMEIDKFYRLLPQGDRNNVIEYVDMDDLQMCSIIPLDVSYMFSSDIQQVSKFNLFMSATILGGKKFLKSLGIDKEKYEIIEVPSKFPLKNRIVTYFPVTQVSSKTTKEGMETLYDVITSICKTHTKDKENGAIFSPSYDFAKKIFFSIRKSLPKCNFLMNLSSSQRDNILEEFRYDDKKSKVLISPSFFEGVNFEDEISRFQIIPKVPFMSLGSEYVKRKMALDKEWYELNALLMVIQACGRSIRHDKDFCDTYILDANFGRLFYAYKKVGYLPKWFCDAVKVINN